MPQSSVVSHQLLVISDNDGAFKLHKSSLCTAGAEPVGLSLQRINLEK
ncbi:hypothetical protein [Nostoc sp.]